MVYFNIFLKNLWTRKIDFFNLLKNVKSNFLEKFPWNFFLFYRILISIKKYIFSMEKIPQDVSSISGKIRRKFGYIFIFAIKNSLAGNRRKVTSTKRCAIKFSNLTYFSDLRSDQQRMSQERFSGSPETSCLTSFLGIKETSFYCRRRKWIQGLTDKNT